MNKVKYYKDGAVEVVRVTQRKRELDREIRIKPSLIHPDGIKSIPPRYPSVAMANKMMLKKGFTR